MRRAPGLVIALVVLAALVPSTGRGSEVGERRVLDNERVAVYEYVFPAGFRGDEHAAVADEFAYVLEGEFTVLTRGKGKQVVPARVLVVLLKGRP